MSDCPSDDTVALYLEGTLSDEQVAAFRQHLDGCDACRAVIAEAARGTGHLDTTRLGFRVGEVLGGKYRIEELIGTGGMGAVFRARHLDLDRDVAIKAIHRELQEDANALKRLMREAKATAALNSQHVVRVLDIERAANGIPYVVMELLEGKDLHRVISEGGALSYEHVIDIGLQVCDALAAAHAQGIVHRDLKPSNLLLLPDGTVKVVDFGLAKRLSFEPAGPPVSLDTGTAMLGSPHFIAPEQIRSARNVDGRVDIWSLGATLYMLLCGAPPFDAPNIYLLCSRILTGVPAPIERRRPGIPPVLREVIERCLEKSPEARFATADDLAAALRRAHEMIDALGPITEAEVRPPSSKAPTRRAEQLATLDSDETATSNVVTPTVLAEEARDDERHDPTMTWRHNR